MTSTDTAGLPSARTSSATTRATRSSAPPRSAPGCESARRPLGGVRSCSRSSRRSRIEPLRGNVDTRLRKLRERGLDAIMLAACGLDRLGLGGEIGARLDPERDAAGGRAGRARAPGARRRGGARRARRSRARRGGASSPSGAASRAIGARLPGAGRRPPRRAHAACADRRRGRRVDRAALGRRSRRARRERCSPRGRARARRRVKVDRHPAAGAGGAARRPARGARRRGRRVPADRDRAHLRRPDRRAGYDWLVVTSPNGADELARRGAEPAARRGGRARHGRGAARAWDRAGVRAGGVVAGRPAARVPAAGRARALRRGRGRAARADRRARRRLRPALPDAAARAGAARRRRRRARLGLGRARVRRRSAAGAGRHDRPGDVARRPRRSGSTVAAEAASHDLDGLVAAVRDLMKSRPMTVITFLTDFGLEDDFVGTCHGVIARIAPDARVIDVTHGIPPQAVLQGALVLRNTTPYMPVGVHLAVVDPGRRRRPSRGRGPHARRARLRRARQRPADARGRRARDRGRARARPTRATGCPTSRARSTRATSSRRPPRISRPVSRSSELGPALDPATLVRRRRARARGRALAALARPCSSVDRFGNVATNVRREHVDALGVANGDRVEIRLTLDRYYARRRRARSPTRRPAS